MREFFLTMIRLLTGRIRHERQAAFIAIEHASDDAWLSFYGDAETAAKMIHAFLLGGEFPR